MFVEYLELIPVLIVGIISGLVGAVDNLTHGDKHAFLVGIKMVLTSTFICLIAFMVLTSVELPYLARVGISAVIGFLGFERAIEIAKDLINIKKGKPPRDMF